MVYKPQYGVYKTLIEKGKQKIYTKDINAANINDHFYSCINILKDGIETPEVQAYMINVEFVDGEDIDLSIFDYIINLMMWQLCTSTETPIESIHLAFFENITKRNIKEYIDNIFIDKYRKKIPSIRLNQIIDDVIGKFRDFRQFQMYLANTLNLKDTIDLMNKYPEFKETVHFDASKIPLEDVKEKGMEAVNIQVKYIIDSDHCLRDSFRTGEAVSIKQYKEVAVNIGTKPDGQGSVFPRSINHSFMNGGLSDAVEICIESSVGRVAQILQKTNVGESGAFARNLELNNQNTILHIDPHYSCGTRNFERVTIKDKKILELFDLRYYRESPNGMEKILHAKRDKHLIGKTLYFRSPMKCASFAHDHGICYRCYGDLAYTNTEVNIGEVASEGLSSIYTQILLSAKHLLESLIIKLEWPNEFYNYFSIAFNTFGLRSDGIFKGKKLKFDEDVKSKDEMDNSVYNYYVNSFIVEDEKGNEVRIHTSNADNIYLMPELYDYYEKCRSEQRSDSEQDIVEMDMVKLMDFPCLFIMEMRNNELSRTMDNIEKLIDNNSVIQKYDADTILEEFIDQNLAGGIKMNAVHFEILLANQIRAIDDELELPDWTIPDVPYQMISLSKSLTNNRSIGIRLQSSKIDRTLLSPQNSKLKKPATIDLFYMEKPQPYLNQDIISDNNNIKSDKDVNIEVPMRIIDPEKEKKK